MTDRYRAGKRLWSAEDDKLMRRLYACTRTDVLAKQLRRSTPSVYGRAKLLGLSKSAAYLASPDACRLRRGDNVGAGSRFKPGHVPANKGLRRPGWSVGRMRETQFKPGCATRWMPVGSTRLIDGYVYRKISDVRKVPWTVNWKPDHVLLWERERGPIPAGHALAFLNGNRTDIRLDNLECITRRELMKRNTVHNLPIELARTIQLLGALNRQIRSRDHAEEDKDRRPA